MTHRFGSFFALCLLSLVLVGMYTSDSSAQWANGQIAEFVVGQTDFVSADTGVSNTLFGVLGAHAVAIDSAHHKMYMSDPTNHRVLRFAYPVTANGAVADLAFGQADLDSNAAPGVSSASTLNRPWGVDLHNGDLWVVERYDARILRYPHAWTYTSNGPAADLVLGAPDFGTVNPGTSQTQLQQPRGMCFDAPGNLWVADGNNNRVLEYVNASSKSSGAPADKVLGQSNFTSAAFPSPPTRSSMNTPYGVCFEGSTLWVADANNNRVLRFDNAGSKANGGAADGVLGQPNFISSSVPSNPTAASQNIPTALVVDGNGTLYLCDYQNHRVLIYDAASSKSDGGNANNVLGQGDFTSDSRGTTQTTMGYPNGIQIDIANGKLLVCDEANHRVLQYSASSHPLPIQLSSFAASASSDGVRLTWETMSEVNNYGFEIQRSPASAIKQWSKAGFVAGYGTSPTAHSYSFVDALANGLSSYRLKQIDLSGEFRFSDPVDVNSVAGATDQKLIPKDFLLTQNYPNPFNPSTQIEYDLPKGGEVSLVVYDILGREVTTLANGYHEAGKYTARWDAGVQASGVYIARVKVSGGGGGTVFTKNIKLLLTK
jgi:sugar lactone lactonase YvrE